MFGAHVDNIPAVRFRGTTSTNIAAATKFIDTAYKHLLANNAFARGDKLDPEDPSSTIQVESLDQLIGEAGDAGDAANSGRRPEWQSSPLVQQRTEVQYSTLLSQWPEMRTQSETNRRV